MRKPASGHLIENILEPVCSALNEEAAQKLIDIKADRKVQARVSRLARKCNEGELSHEERAEYETYVMIGDVLAILQARARLLLSKRRQPA